jgi:hypothetical protein
MGFQELLSMSPSFLLILLGCSCTLVASIMRRSKFPELVERISASCNSVVWSYFKLCSSKVNLSDCVRCVLRWCSFILVPVDLPVWPIYILGCTRGDAVNAWCF